MRRRDVAENAGVRLQRYLAMTGVASRRKSEDLIAAGLVTVNGRTVTRPGTTVDPDRDEVAVRGRVLGPRPREDAKSPLVVALHKPRGVLTSRSHSDGGKAGGEATTVYDLIEEPPGTRMIYVGRLDRDSEGLLLLTSNGTLAHRLTHPRWQVERAYEASVSGPLDERALQRAARSGIVLDDGDRTAPFRARILRRGRAADHPPAHARSGSRSKRIELVLTEGRKREVRRIVEALGGRVERLVRTRYGTVEIAGLEPGRWRKLPRHETARLCELVELTGPRPAGRS